MNVMNWKTAGLLVGLLFGFVLIWQGAGDAALVLLFGFLGWLVFAIGWFVSRMISGDIDVTAIRQLLTTITSGGGGGRGRVR
jgi:hypothetical protein